VLCRAGSHSPCYPMHVFPVVLETVCGVILTCCLDCVLLFVVNGVVKQFSSSPYFLLTPEKKYIYIYIYKFLHLLS
jgi:hypothetical protein